MINQPQDLLADIEDTQVNYSTFWQRFFASLIDGLILIPFIVIDTFNKSTWKSLPLFLITFIIALAYKPFLEARYKATLGKMAMKLTIVDVNFDDPAIKNIILRNVFDISSRLIIGITTFITFMAPEFQKINSTAAYTSLSNAMTGATWITLALSLLSLVDAIFLIADPRRRALHDIIGQTFVIQK